MTRTIRARIIVGCWAVWLAVTVGSAVAGFGPGLTGAAVFLIVFVAGYNLVSPARLRRRRRCRR